MSGHDGDLDLDIVTPKARAHAGDGALLVEVVQDFGTTVHGQPVALYQLVFGRPPVADAARPAARTPLHAAEDRPVHGAQGRQLDGDGRSEARNLEQRYLWDLSCQLDNPGHVAVPRPHEVQEALPAGGRELVLQRAQPPVARETLERCHHLHDVPRQHVLAGRDVVAWLPRPEVVAQRAFVHIQKRPDQVREPLQWVQVVEGADLQESHRHQGCCRQGKYARPRLRCYIL